MRTRIALGIAFTFCWSVALRADFSYQQTSKITGGALAGAMKVVGVFSKQAREPVESTVIVKGDRMATISPQSASIIDLQKETVTQIDFHRKTYSVMTFAQLADLMKQMDEQMKSEKGKPVQNLTFKASVRRTGETKSVGGVDTHEAILKIEMIGTDEKTGEPVTAMVITTDMWLAKPVAGYEEIRDFHRRMAQKLSWAPNMGMMSQPGMARGMAELGKEMSKLDGMPILQLVSMGGPESGQAAGQPEAAPQPTPQAQEEKPSGGMLGRLAGGRFGGFGHKKNQDQDQQQQGPPPGGGVLMEMTTELSGFSTDAVDASKFEIPAGFKEVEARTGRR
jgi:hypothetical protein